MQCNGTTFSSSGPFLPNPRHICDDDVGNAMQSKHFQSMTYPQICGQKKSLAAQRVTAKRLFG
jgi:hypothetical protein